MTHQQTVTGSPAAMAAAMDGKHSTFRGAGVPAVTTETPLGLLGVSVDLAENDTHVAVICELAGHADIRTTSIDVCAAEVRDMSARTRTRAVNGVSRCRKR